MRTFASAFLSALLFLFAFRVPLKAQRDLSGAPEIALQLEKLNVLGSVLMIAAHPDDENTALLAYFARGGTCARPTFATRGEGGQNLIGSEQGDLLGMIRTQELLARGESTAPSSFSPAPSTSASPRRAEETLQKWGRERILSDIVWMIRNFRPDVDHPALLRHAARRPRPAQASAILGKEAYSAAADPKRVSRSN